MREWIQATLENGVLDCLLGPSARGHTAPSLTKAPDTAEYASDAADAPTKSEFSRSFRKPWICPKCDIEMALQDKRRGFASGTQNREACVILRGIDNGLVLGLDIALANQLPSLVWKPLADVIIVLLPCCSFVIPFAFLGRDSAGSKEA